VVRVLLHTETADGSVVPIWEEVTEENVVALKDIMAARQTTNGVDLQYYRVPITAERPPDFTDLSDLIDVVIRASTNTPIVVNCQLGRGRSTLASVGQPDWSFRFVLSFPISDHIAFDSAMVGKTSVSRRTDCSWTAQAAIYVTQF